MKRMTAALIFFVFASNAYSQQIPAWKITDVEKLMHSKSGDILVLNFWATFCKPCVAEIPSFIQVADKYKDERVKLILISLDLPAYFPAKIDSFARKNNFNTNIAWLQETNADYFCPKIDTSWSGSIPATLILNTKTGYRFFNEGEMRAEEFERALKASMK